MQYVGFFEAPDFLRRKMDIERSDRLLQVLHAAGADDGCGDKWFTEDPGQCDLRATRAACVCDLPHAFGDLKILITVIKAVAVVIGLGAYRIAPVALAVIAGEETARHWAPGDDR